MSARGATVRILAHTAWLRGHILDANGWAGGDRASAALAVWQGDDSCPRQVRYRRPAVCSCFIDQLS
ncbi:hypothetical protein PsYK624_152630 [Phanerochaete sordida]|uniref:Uncharacterized protein n=1 Tax=Phanerochaete sordida TaxID=48140 RepID=A0A9P3LL49_9APHY|nr:hypothetical protein PsYK624_152630 [Phanerochaete sordida]